MSERVVFPVEDAPEELEVTPVEDAPPIVVVDVASELEEPPDVPPLDSPLASALDNDPSVTGISPVPLDGELVTCSVAAEELTPWPDSSKARSDWHASASAPAPTPINK